MELYAERGYDQVTADEIAERAGVTARTFFRHFADKREVLFFGSDAVLEALRQALAASDPANPPLAAVADALGVVARLLGNDHGHSARRRNIIQANPELHERELSKMSGWSQALAEGLNDRGVDAPSAKISAEVGVAIFQIAFDHWVSNPPVGSLTEELSASFRQLHTLTAG